MESSPLAFLNYIADESFRISLESDYRELTHAVTGGHWKSVHVLAGSIVEALLSDYLLDKKPDQEARILRLDLGSLVGECKTDGVLSSDTADLCVVVKNYRNLIHPGRMKRLGETVSEDRGQIALRLVKLVAEDVSKTRRDTYGYTGEQIIEKIRNDPSALPTLIGSITPKLRARERQRLLLKLLPEENVRLRRALLLEREREPYQFDYPAEQRIWCVQLVYRTLHKEADKATKSSVLKQYMQLLHNGTESERQAYEAGLLFADIYLEANVEDQSTITAHLLSELRRHASVELFSTASNLPKLLTSPDHIWELLQIAVSCDPNLDKSCREWLGLWYAFATADLRTHFWKALDGRIEWLSDNNRPTHRLEELRSYLSEDPIPF